MLLRNWCAFVIRYAFVVLLLEQLTLDNTQFYKHGPGIDNSTFVYCSKPIGSWQLWAATKQCLLRNTNSNREFSQCTTIRDPSYISFHVKFLLLGVLSTRTNTVLPVSWSFRSVILLRFLQFAVCTHFSSKEKKILEMFSDHHIPQ